MSQKFCNILQMKGTIQLLWMVLPRSWRGQIRLDKLTWYSLSATHQSCLHDLENCLGIHGFRLIRSCLIVKVLATQAKFLELSDYCTVINCTFNFCIKDILVAFMVWTCKAWIPKLNYIVYSSIHLSNHTWNEAMQIMSMHSPIILPTTLGTFLSLWHMHRKQVHAKILQNFWVTLVRWKKY